MSEAAIIGSNFIRHSYTSDAIKLIITLRLSLIPNDKGCDSLKDVLLMWFLIHSILLCISKKYRMYEIEFLKKM